MSPALEKWSFPAESRSGDVDGHAGSDRIP
jgi:hypothetical protein